MIIYRVENDKGIGPYVSGEIFRISRMTLIHPTRRPEPNEEQEFIDCGLAPHNFNYGFSSLEQLMEWFSVPELREMFAAGFKIKTFDSLQSITVVSETQVGFNVKESKCLSVISSMVDLRQALKLIS